jgi:hypothetical protein
VSADEQSPETTTPVIVESPVQDILIDGFINAQWGPDVIQLNLYRDRLPPDPDASNQRVLVARLCMGISALVPFQEGLTDILDALKKQGYFKDTTEQQIPESKGDATRTERDTAI